MDTGLYDPSLDTGNDPYAPSYPAPPVVAPDTPATPPPPNLNPANPSQVLTKRQVRPKLTVEQQSKVDTIKASPEYKTGKITDAQINAAVIADTSR